METETSSDSDDSDTSFLTNSSCSSSTTSRSSVPEEFDDPFEDLYHDDTGIRFEDTEPTSPQLFAGSSLNVLGSLAILFSWFSAFPGISKQALNQLFHILHYFILPPGNSLPATYAAALSIIQPLLSPKREYHCCPNDCIIYRGPHADDTHCHVCGEERYLEKSIPKKRFKYLPLISRVERYFKNKTISKLFQDHIYQPATADVHDIHQTSTWKEWYGENGIFHGDSRGLALALCTDGTNPFAKEKNSYSMWPIMITFLNLPSSLRRSAGFLQLVGIIPGKHEPKNTDTYLQVLVDELRDMNGTRMYDAYRQCWFELRVELLLHILDYPGQNKVLHCNGELEICLTINAMIDLFLFMSHTGAGAYSGCCYCMTKGEHSKALSKVVYLDHRRFLSPNDPLRKEKKGFPTKKLPKGPPLAKDMSFIDRTNLKLEKADTKKKEKKIIRNTGFKGTYCLRKLSFHDRYLNTPVEPMHLVKNIVEHIVRLISGAEDSHKVRAEEKVRGRFSAAWVTASKPNRLPQAPFRLTVEEAKMADARLIGVQVPKGFDWKPKPLFSVKALGMKSHSWKQLVSSNMLKYCLRGLLGQQQRQTLFFFCNVLAQLCAESVNMLQVQQLEFDVHESLSLLERDFPVSMHVIVFHLLHHLPLYLNRFGPCCVYWMYPYERFNSWVIRRVQNRRYPESTVIETYRLFEWAHFLQRAGKLPKNAITLPTSIDSEYENIKTDAMAMLNPVEFANLESLYIDPDLRSQLKREVIKMKTYTYTDIHDRSLMLTSIASDSRFTVSSYVYTLLHDKSIKVYGRIQFFFKHSLSLDVYAYVHWFSKPKTDPETELLFVYVNSFSSFNPIMLVSNLSRPLVTAIDIDTPNKLWILSSI